MSENEAAQVEADIPTEEDRAQTLGKELAAMDAHAQEHHGISLSSLLAQVIQRLHGINLHPRTVADADGKTSLKIGG